MKLYIKAAKEQDSAISTLMSMPKHIAGGLSLLSTPIYKEKCGNCSNLDEAEQYVISRTVDNKQSKRSKDSGTLDLIHDVFDYARNNNISVSKLITMGGCWERYSSAVHYSISSTNKKYKAYLRESRNEARHYYDIHNY